MLDLSFPPEVDLLRDIKCVVMPAHDPQRPRVHGVSMGLETIRSIRVLRNR